MQALVDPRTGERAGAASGVILRGGRLLVVQDDSLTALWIDPGTLAMERVTLLGDGGRLTKQEKADFEAVLETPDGTILALGSGGTDRRKRIVVYDAGTSEVRTIDATALYDALAARLPEPPNIEGAALAGDGITVRLFHRANGKQGARRTNNVEDCVRSAADSAPPSGAPPPRNGLRPPSEGTKKARGAPYEGGALAPYEEGALAPYEGGALNATFDVALASLLAGSGPIVDEALHDLGWVLGPTGEPVALTFTDAARLGDRLIYLAAAEDCEDAIADGPVVGAAIGVLEAEGGRYALLTEEDGSPSCRKIEGIALHPGGREAFVVTDPDDEHRASELCTVTLEGPW